MEYWVQRVRPKKCALKHWMGKSCDSTISNSELDAMRKIPVGGQYCHNGHCKTMTTQAKRRVNFATVARTFKHPGRSKRTSAGR